MPKKAGSRATTVPTMKQIRTGDGPFALDCHASTRNTSQPKTITAPVNPATIQLGSNRDQPGFRRRRLVHATATRIAGRTTTVMEKTKSIGIGLTNELSDAGSPARPHWHLTRPARVRSSDFVKRHNRLHLAGSLLSPVAEMLPSHKPYRSAHSCEI